MSVMALRSSRFTCRSICHLLNKSQPTAARQTRTLLSEAYYCHNEWKNRIQTPTLQKIDAEEFAIKLQEKFDREGAIYPVDMDIFANKLDVLPRIQLDFAQSLIHKFRHTKATVQVTESTPHAIIRTLLERKEYDRLREILRDKIHYGVFLDQFSANLLIDHYIMEKKYLEAAEVAFDLMLQEDFSHPINKVLAWYSCHLLWRNPELMRETDHEETAEQEEEDEEEEVYIPVAFLENYWYDDHFDIPTVQQLLGKTLTMLSANQNDPLALSYRLIGWGLYQKFDKGLELMKACIEREGESLIIDEAMADFSKRLESLETKEPPSEPKDPGMKTLEDEFPFITEEQKATYLEQFKILSDQLNSTSKVANGLSLDDELLSVVNKTVKQVESTDVSQYGQLIQTWNSEREKLVEQQIQEYKDAQLKEELEARLLKLKETEERLTFYDNKYREKIFKKTRLGEKKEEVDKLFESEEMQHWAPRT